MLAYEIFGNDLPAQGGRGAHHAMETGLQVGGVAKYKKTHASVELEAKIQRALGHRSDDLDLYGPIVSNGRSEIYYGEGTAYPTPVAVKVCFDHEIQPSASDTAAASFRSMQLLHEITSRDSALASPTPYDLFPDLAAVVAEWVDGQSLASLLKRAPAPAAGMTSRDAGAWLARLAAVAGHSRKPLDTAKWLEGLPAEGPTPLRRAISTLQRTADLARTRDVVWSRCLGDFKPANLLLSRGRIFGIDAQMVDIGPTTIDAAHFLNHAVLLRATPASGYAVSDDAGLTEAFRRGHESGGGLELPAFQLLWTRLFAAVHLASDFRMWSHPPRAWIMSWVMRRLLGHLQDELEASAQS